MRKSRSGATRPFRPMRFILAGMLASAGIVASTIAVSYQDVAALVGVNADNSNRWLAHLITVPVGTNVQKSSDRLSSSGVVEHALALRTGDEVQIIRRLPSNTGVNTPTLDRSMKGDRVVGIVRKAFNASGAESLMLQTHSLLLEKHTPGLPTSAQNNRLIAMAQQFHPTLSTDASQFNTAGVLRGSPMLSGLVRVAISKGQLDSVRIAARQMAKLQSEKIRNEDARETMVAAINFKQKLKPAPTSVAMATKDIAIDGKVSDEVVGSVVVSAYAADSAPQTSPFDAVLRPTLPKARPKQKRTIITLAKGDHKWALNALPKKTFSAAQRRCLAIGVYFESRGEPVKGQRAVAQVILNRVKNPAYPKSVCGVVYQNKHKRNRCQFSFACDRVRDRIRSPSHWKVATGVANDAIDGKVWLKAVGSSSHYHADYVRPRWRRSMKRLVKIGRHIFYRTYGGGWI